MDIKNKLTNKKVSKKFLIIGGILLVVGIILGIVGVIAHEKAIDEWWAGNADMPGFPFYGILGFLGAGVGLFLVSIGLTPLMVKLMAKLGSEAMDVAGKDISEVSVKSVEVMTPAMRKKGEVLTPIISDIVKEVKKVDTGNAESETPDKYCPYCGQGLENEYKFCPKCGKEL